jgi:hypothetical protein
LTVCESSLSTRAISRYWPVDTASVAGSAAYSHVKTTSSAVKGLPSCHWTPFFSLRVTDKPSRATSPFWTVGTSATRTGTMLPSGSNDTSGS